jgi:hypothetical protein
MFCVSAVFFFVNLMTPQREYTIISLSLQITLVLDIGAMLTVSGLNNRRLQQEAQLHDHTVADESLRIANYLLVACIGTVLASLAIYLSDPKDLKRDPSNVIMLIFGGLALTLNMALSMFFLITDLKVSNLLLDQLHILADKQLLTMDVFNRARDDIHRRVRNGRWASDFIVGPCVASVVTIAVIVYRARGHDWGLGTAWIVFLLKELIFVSVAFWYTAKVNGKADALTEKLADQMWLSNTAGFGNDVEGNSFGSAGWKNASFMLDKGVGGTAVVGKGQKLGDHDAALQQSLQQLQHLQHQHHSVVSELHRLAIYTSSLTNPISFTLLFKRVSWENVAVTASGFVVTVLVGLIQQLVQVAQER